MRAKTAALLCSASLLFLVPLAARAQILPTAADDFRFLLGAGLRHGPEYWGSAKSDTSLKPLWALRWGRWRLSTSGASGLMGFGNEAVGPGPGASRDLFRSERLSVGFGLRIDNGRTSADAASTEGLPDVRRTLRGRLYGSYAIAPTWFASAALSQDLLGRRGGAILSLDLSHQLYRSAGGELTAFAGVSAGDGAQMRSYFGVPADSAAALRYGRAYAPGAGLRDAAIGLNYTRAVNHNWVGYAGLSASTLLDAAQGSPLNQRRTAFGWSFGLAYRN